ncbi:pyridine nucleotide-disulfide oxidoreductase [Steroidobacter denitrificans]|uniref:Probable soluble pyridine nucleotide transhydrogenase n=1 Tax=Steroidobacter denitrificans TaxID=465721 RepID=A0A127FDH6_STEDE|nr:Si-specific NAD(P)(+) transhydrogenase [Steroidobacter denitrificans]AMN48417.1 pyridine nucleotide-disulfide oxidoreductase [Steroidobacter denitrificans]
MKMQKFDVLVIGSGPAGEGAAMMAAKNRLKVALIERHFEVGGGCTHWGTIPSKALRHAVKVLHDLKRNPLLREQHLSSRLTYPQLLASAANVIDLQVASRRRSYDRNRVPIFGGEARLLDAHTLQVQPGAGKPYRLSAKHIVIAAGSRPYHPPDVDFTHPRVRDSDSILRYAEHPFSVTIYGAGVIGCEYASIFINLGAKVTLVNTHDRLLSFLDDEIAEALSYHLREQGCVIRHNEEFEAVEAREHDVLLHLTSGRRIKSDVLLWANGRTGASQTLQLSAVGLESNLRGQIPVNGHYQTAVPNIYAVGDIAGPPALASAAYVQGSHAVQHILDPAIEPHCLEMIPSGIYTIPEISSVGKSERELQELKAPYEVGHCAFKNLARAQMTDERVGMLKIIFHAENLQVLGVHCFGDNASEIVHIGQTVMASSELNDVRYFTRTTFNYPTMAEAYRVAAYNGLNRLS